MPMLSIKYNRILYGEAILSAPQNFDPRDQKKYSLEETSTHRFLLWLVENLFRTAMVMRVEGQENFPLDGSVIVAANHVTNFDVFPIQFAVPRAICFMGKVELFNTRLILFCAYFVLSQSIAAERMSGRYATQRKC